MQSIQYVLGLVVHWYRDCNLGNSDIDMCIDLNWFMSNIEQLHVSLKTQGWIHAHTFGTQHKIGYEEAWKLNGVKVDLFSMKSVNDIFYTGLTVRRITYLCKSFISDFKTHKWSGVSFIVPEPVEVYLTSLSKYGDWSMPAKNYVWYQTPFENKGKKEVIVIK